ncbi:formin-like protein 4 [Magnolia sinica]|uniref:formin-like protein 4 n=1 Tax=Magnolia sinica TaxID=86752 RepID=UPI00265AA97A|nr:formin-like protein 4 [Magnolia sinica]
MAMFSHGHVRYFSFIIFFSVCVFPSSSSPPPPPQMQFILPSNSPQNIETFFPTGSFPASPSLSPPPSSPPFSPATIPISPTPMRTAPIPPPPDKSKRTTVAKAVVATAASTLVFAGLFFFLLQKFVFARRRRHQNEKTNIISGPRRDEETAVSYDARNLYNGTLKGLVVDENGLDVLYWRNLEKGDGKTGFRKEVLDRPKKEKRNGVGRGVSHSNSDPMPKIKSLSSQSSDSSSRFSISEIRHPDRVLSPPRTAITAISVPTVGSTAPLLVPPTSPPNSKRPPPPPPVVVNKIPAAPPTPPPPVVVNKSPAAPPPPPQPVVVNKIPAAPLPPPPIIEKKNPVPPPPPPIPAKKNSIPPPPPPIPAKKIPVPPPVLPRAGSSKRPPVPPMGWKGKASSSKTSEASPLESSKEKVANQTKLKPLHWDKVTANAEHSMVWDKIGGGSFRFDDDLMEALFGYVASNRKPADQSNNSTNPSRSSNPNPPAQTFLLDPRKSQNIAIVLRSLAISRQEILDSLLDGQGLHTDALEKLTKIAPNKEEETNILSFSGNPSKLADAESFLFHLFQTVPSPFLRLDAMLFHSTYDVEILHLKQSLQALESACKELRTRGLFLKLLEAVLKAGNRMNAGTARGNAHAFNLAALRKLSDVKSTDGKTTLLHFVVEEVVRSEGKRCVVNRNHSLSRSASNSSPSNLMGKEEREKEYIMLGLPMVGGLSAEFSNVKKAAVIDYDGFITTGSSLVKHVSSIRQFLAGQQVNGEGGGFVREMKGFLETAEEELKVVKAEEARVMDLIIRTTEYYQAGASKEKGAYPLQLFVIVNDFLGMVDQVCVDIARSQQQKKKAVGGVLTQPESSKRVPMRFPNLPAHFLSKTSSSSDSEDEF